LVFDTYVTTSLDIYGLVNFLKKLYLISKLAKNFSLLIFKEYLELMYFSYTWREFWFF